MDFRTEITPEPGYEGLISHSDPVILIGSCFTDNIGGCMRDELFDVTVNPFGPIYNPSSVRLAVETIAERRHISVSDLFEHEGRVHSYLFHSRYSAETAAEALLKMNSSIVSAHDSLKRAGVMIITLGTSRIFREKSNNIVVANCHKMPAIDFDEYMLTVDESYDEISRTIEKARSVNPDLLFIFTVSPLRYPGYGAHGNTLSKAVLHLSVDRAIRENDGVCYFPSYEIMMDDLRDYRFYAEDMRHPTPQAVRYIYSVFGEQYFNPATRELSRVALKLTRRLSHRPMSTMGVEAEDIKKIIDLFKHTYPTLSPIVDKYLTDGIQYK